MSIRLISLLFAVVLVAGGCAPPTADAEVAARVGQRAISLTQVDIRVQQDDPETWQSLYQARRRALDSLIDDQLLAEEARRLAISADSLIAREITATVAAVTDSQVQVFYAQNKARMGNQTLTEMTDPIRAYLAADGHNSARQSYLTTLRRQADVTISLAPPRVSIEVDNDEPARGPVDAPVVIVEYSDFACPYCGRVQPALEQVMATYGDRVRLVFRDYPLAIHEDAHLAAQAAQCAHDQGHFWAYHDKLFANPRELRAVDLRRYAAAVGLDTVAFGSCLDSGRHATAIDADFAAGERHGVTGTPAFFINGRPLSGAQPFAAFQQLVDEELQR